MLKREGQIDIWPIRVYEPCEQQLLTVLSRSEAHKASQLRNKPARETYLVTRAVLRLLISKYIACDPRNILFSYNQYGKPRLLDSSQGLHFNVAHTANAAIIAVVMGCEIGIDIESICFHDDLMAVAEHCFCGEEIYELLSMGGEARTEMFFKCWTRKEAYTKATGEGLFLPLNSFCVSVADNGPPYFRHISNSMCGGSKWNLHDLNTFDACAGALAYQGVARQVAIQPIMTAEDFL